MISGSTTSSVTTEVLRGVQDKSYAALKESVRFSRRKPMGAIGLGILLTLILIAILAPIISPHDPEEIFGLDADFAAPNKSLPLGGDNVGRDVLSRIFYGARISLFVGLVSISIGVTGGSLLGLISAYFGGAVDMIIQRLVDIFMAIPGIILALVIIAALGSSSITNVIIALVFVLTPASIRTVRSQALAVREMDYVLAARAVGASDWRIIFRHMVPNCFAIFMIVFTIYLGYAILVEASLSFLGVGLPPNVASWGSMLVDTKEAYVFGTWWLPFFPGIAISLAVFGVNLFGDAMRDVLDPRLRGAT
jgi:peptide/nickel transport system permease protein